MVGTVDAYPDGFARATCPCCRGKVCLSPPIEGGLAREIGKFLGVYCSRGCSNCGHTSVQPSWDQPTIRDLTRDEATRLTTSPRLFDALCEIREALCMRKGMFG